jgi:hypothetical protein
MCMHACMHTYVQTDRQKTHTDRQTDIHKYIHTYMHTCMHAHTHMCVYIYATYMDGHKVVRHLIENTFAMMKKGMLELFEFI